MWSTCNACFLIVHKVFLVNEFDEAVDLDKYLDCVFWPVDGAASGDSTTMLSILIVALSYRWEAWVEEEEESSRSKVRVTVTFFMATVVWQETDWE